MPRGEAMRIIMIPLIIAVASCSVQPPASTEGTRPPPRTAGQSQFGYRILRLILSMFG
jgi:hypothetical protein